MAGKRCSSVFCRREVVLWRGVHLANDVDSASGYQFVILWCFCYLLAKSCTIPTNIQKHSSSLQCENHLLDLNSLRGKCQQSLFAGLFQNSLKLKYFYLVLFVRIRIKRYDCGCHGYPGSRSDIGRNMWIRSLAVRMLLAGKVLQATPGTDQANCSGVPPGKRPLLVLTAPFSGISRTEVLYF